MMYLELAGYILVILAIAYMAILIVLCIIMPILAWALRKVLGR